jgi:hypothetical protein
MSASERPGGTGRAPSSMLVLALRQATSSVQTFERSTRSTLHDSARNAERHCSVPVQASGHHSVMQLPF